MSIFDRQYIYSPNRLDWITGLETAGVIPGFGFNPNMPAGSQADAQAANYKYLTQGEADRTAYMNNFLGGGPAGPTYGGIVSGPSTTALGQSTQGDMAIKGFSRQWENPLFMLHQLGINVPMGPPGPIKKPSVTLGPEEPDPFVGQRAAVNDPGSMNWLAARGYSTTPMGTSNPGTMMQSGGVMGQIANNFGWNPNQQPMMNNAGWGQANDYWGNSW